MENNIPKELQDIIDKHQMTPMKRTLEDHLNESDVRTIEMKVYTFDVFNYKLYVVTQIDHVPYIQKYIDTIKNGNPDKDSVIREYAINNQNMSESLIERILNNKNNNVISGKQYSGIYSELNRVEHDLKHIIDALKRDKKINNLLDGDISE